jgi:hypothetical protein
MKGCTSAASDCITKGRGRSSSLTGLKVSSSAGCTELCSTWSHTTHKKQNPFCMQELDSGIQELPLTDRPQCHEVDHL